jgi:hypothetical protein
LYGKSSVWGRQPFEFRRKKQGNTYCGSEIGFYCYTPCKEGTIVCVYQFPTGATWDDPQAQVGPPQGTLANTIPAGVMQQEVIEFDNTRMSMDMSDDERIMVGSKVGIETKGWFYTRCLAASADPVLGGKPAYYDMDGYFTTTDGRVSCLYGLMLAIEFVENF